MRLGVLIVYVTTENATHLQQISTMRLSDDSLQNLGMCELLRGIVRVRGHKHVPTWEVFDLPRSVGPLLGYWRGFRYSTLRHEIMPDLGIFPNCTEIVVLHAIEDSIKNDMMV